MAPGWKTYWRSPGETGIPPKFDWSGSKNIRRIEVFWPRPELFQSFGMQTAGYSNVVLFPLGLMPIDPAQPMHLKLRAELGVCKEICVLEHVHLSLDIQPEDREIGARQIRSAMRRVPDRPVRGSSGLKSCRFGGNGRYRTMTAEILIPEDLSNPVVLVENTRDVWIRKSTQKPMPEGLRVDVDFMLPEGTGWIDRSAFRMTVLANERAWEINGCTTR